MIELAAGDYQLTAAPERGGSILRFDWRGLPLMRPARGPSILDVACFPLVPFSNRIAGGHFTSGGREVALRPNLPGADHPHPLHGFGWLRAWDVIAVDDCSVTMEHVHSADAWRWAYRARQTVRLDEDGLVIALAVTNESGEPMPLGVGFHPFFVRNAETRYRGMHRGEWHNDGDCLPLALDLREEPLDWWNGKPVGTRCVDTVYTERAGPLEIVWPDRNLRMILDCSDHLGRKLINWLEVWRLA